MPKCRHCQIVNNDTTKFLKKGNNFCSNSNSCAAHNKTNIFVILKIPNTHSHTHLHTFISLLLVYKAQGKEYKKPRVLRKNTFCFTPKIKAGPQLSFLHACNHEWKCTYIKVFNNEVEVR